MPPVLHNLLSLAASHLSLPLIPSHVTERAEVAQVEEAHPSSQACCSGPCQVPGCPCCDSTSHQPNQGKEESVIHLLWSWEAFQETCHTRAAEKSPGPPLLSFSPAVLVSCACSCSHEALEAAAVGKLFATLLGSALSLLRSSSVLQLDLSPGFTPRSVAW